MKHIFFTIILFSSLSISAQEKRYFNRGFQKQYPSYTNYKREYEVSKDSIITKDEISGKLNSEGIFYGFDSLKNVDMFFRYYRNRRYNRTEGLTLNNRKALVTYYNREGNIDKKVLYQDDTVYHIQVWNKKEEVLVDGSGKYEFIHSNGTENIMRKYQDSLLVLDIGIRLDKNDTIYYLTNKAAYPKEGLSKFHRQLTGYLKYPEKARRRGLEAKIMVQFVVEVDGKLTDFKALTSYGHSFEGDTIEKLSQLPPWTPAIFNDKPVKTKFHLPVTFRLN